MNNIPDDSNLNDLFCADVSREMGEPMFGTAPTIDAWLLLEYRGPWAAKATDDNDLPTSIRSWLAEGLILTGNGRLQFIKQSQPAATPGIIFFIALTQELAPRLYEFHFDAYDDLHALDLPAVFSGAAGYDHFLRTEPLYLICTNGRRDRCCSRLGPALYQSLTGIVGDAVWQSTHLGGHRYAPTLFTFPDGTCYGRLAPSDLAPFVQAQSQGELFLDFLRGRCCYANVVQAAEFFLRQATGLRARDAYRLRDAQPIDGTHYSVRFEEPATGQVHRLTISKTMPDENRLVSCSPVKTKPVAQFRLISHQLEL